MAKVSGASGGARTLTATKGWIEKPHYHDGGDSAPNPGKQRLCFAIEGIGEKAADARVSYLKEALKVHDSVHVQLSVCDSGVGVFSPHWFYLLRIRQQLLQVSVENIIRVSDSLWLKPGETFTVMPENVFGTMLGI